MCYPLPGPRCSGHAKKILVTANQNYQKAKLSGDDAIKMDAYRKFADAEREYLMTPGGHKHLRERIVKTKDPGGKLSMRLEMGIKARAEGIRLAKMTDVGDIDTHTKDIRKMSEAEMTAADKAYAKRMRADQETLEQRNATRAEQGLAPLSSVNSIRLDDNMGTHKAYSNYNPSLIPQANDLEKVSSTVDAIGNKANTSGSIGESLGVHSRQGNYYANAAEYIGLVEKTQGENNEFEYHLTTNGERFRQAGAKDRKAMLQEMVNATPVMASYRESGYNQRSLVEEIRASGYEEETAKRRAAAITVWHKKLGDNNFSSVLEGSRRDVSQRSVGAAQRLAEARAERKAKEEAPAKKDFGFCQEHGMALNAAGKCVYCDD